MPRYFCHTCSDTFDVDPEDVDGWDGVCPECEEGFIEEVEPPPAPGGQAPVMRFALPGGLGVATIAVGAAGGIPGGGSGVHISGEQLQALVAGAPFVFPGGAPGGPGAAAAAPEQLRAALESMLRGGLGLGLGAGGPAPQDEAWDRMMTQIMDSYAPPARATAARVRDALPRLRVRPRGAAGEPAEGEAVVAAGEPCSVCHDAYAEGEEVAELPCSHCFHRGCITPWLETNNSCPVCRLELPAEDAGVERQRRRRAAAAGGGAGGARGAPERPGAAAGSGGAAAGGASPLSDLMQQVASTVSALSRQVSGLPQHGLREPPPGAAAGGGGARVSPERQEAAAGGAGAAGGGSGVAGAPAAGSLDALMQRADAAMSRISESAAAMQRLGLLPGGAAGGGGAAAQDGEDEQRRRVRRRTASPQPEPPAVAATPLAAAGTTGSASVRSRRPSSSTTSATAAAEAPRPSPREAAAAAAEARASGRLPPGPAAASGSAPPPAAAAPPPRPAAARGAGLGAGGGGDLLGTVASGVIGALAGMAIGWLARRPRGGE